MTDYAFKKPIHLTAKGKRWMLSKLDQDDPLRPRLIDELRAADEPLDIPGEFGCMERGHRIDKCDAPRCRAKHRALLLGIARRYERTGNVERAQEYRERWRRR